jgi:gas vesicle protein
MAENNSGVGAIWFVAGAAVGATLALLFAPESGQKTRRRLAKHAQRGSQALSNGGRDLYDRGRDVYDRGREIAEEAAEMFERGRKLAEKKVDEVL